MAARVVAKTANASPGVSWNAIAPATVTVRCSRASARSSVVPTGEEGRGDDETNPPRGFQIYNQLELRGTLYRKLGRAGALQDTIHVDSRSAKQILGVKAVGHEPAVTGVESERIYGGQPVSFRESKNCIAMNRVDRRREQDETTVRVTCEDLDCLGDLGAVPPVGSNRP